MRLTPMRYKSFIWPHNPRKYQIDFERPVAVHKVPFGRHCVQDLGLGGRVMRGEGEFAGEGAYDQLKALADVFYEDGPGLLVHPVWQSAHVYFTQLRLLQEPEPDYVRYSFTFREGVGGYDQGLKALDLGGGPETAAESRRVHTVVRGETLWGIARQYGVELTAVIAANTWLKNPNRIYAGDRVVIPG